MWIGILIFSNSAANAVVSCFHKDFTEYGKLTTKIVEYADSPTHRLTVAEYAEIHTKPLNQITDAVAATGRLNCGKGVLSANLVMKGDVILTVNHPFVDPNTCQKRANPKDCTFTAEGKKSVKIKELIASGNKCPTRGEANADWAILRLEENVTGVVPYKLPDKNARDGVVAQPVIAVGSLSLDFRKTDPKTGKSTFPKHVQDCNIKRIFYRYDPVAVASDCDGGQGKSGGALLAQNLADHIIVGISTSSPFSEAEEKREAKTGIATRKNFDRDKWYDSGLAIDGKLRDELEKATND